MNEPNLPDELTQALLSDRVASSAFEALSVGERAHHAQWVASCQSSDTRAARARDVARMIKVQADRSRRERKRLGPSPFTKAS